MKYLIVGRTGSGKDFVTSELNKRGYTILKSYTTREPRYKGENTHTFISSSESANYTDKVATWTLSDGTEYFATREQVLDSDVYIINPDALIQLIENMPELKEQNVLIIYVSAESYRKRRKMAIQRGDNPKAFEHRNRIEGPEFAKFEEKIINANCDEINIKDLNGNKVLFGKIDGLDMINLINYYDNLIAYYMNNIEDIKYFLSYLAWVSINNLNKILSK